MWLIDVLTGANGRTFQRERRKLRKAREDMVEATAELNGKAAEESPAANLLRHLEGALHHDGGSAEPVGSPD